MQKCNSSAAQRWKYTLAGNLMNAGNKQCLSADTANEAGQRWTVQPCGHNQLNQIWSLPN